MNLGLVLEGGGMRCLYTAGILDCFLDHGIDIKSCYGVSAGAMCGMNYITKQKERTLRTVVNYIHDKDYCSIRSLLKTGDMFGADMLYNRIPNTLDLFDYEAFKQSESRLTIVYSDVEEGVPRYRTLQDLRKEMIYLKASCSLPIISRMAVIDDKCYLDGGITDSIPIMKSMQDHNEYNIVILSKHRSYLKGQEGRIPSVIGRLMYRRYPNVLKAGMERHLHYNQQRSLVWSQENNGKAFVFCPDSSIKVKRMEKNTRKLMNLYQQGYDEARNRIDEVKAFIHKATS